MKSSSSNEVSALLRAWGEGDAAALDRLMPLIYTELRRIAAQHTARERRSQSIQTTVLVHELYLRVVDQDRVHWHDRAHFYAVAAQLMRRILIDHARKRLRAKRGGGVILAALHDSAASIVEEAADVVAVDDALKALSAMDHRKGRIVELRFFGGFSIDETATVLGVSPGTVMRDWTLAKAWLRREISGTPHDGT